jgi:archaemetzincin
VPSGTVNLLVLEQLAASCGDFLSLKTMTLPPFEPPSEAFNSLRRQYHAGMLLQCLQLLQPGCLRVVGITSYDLFLPIFTHVYGEAQNPGRAAVISFFRIGPSEGPHYVDHAGFLERAIKITIHELLHTFGLVHCRHSACLMHTVMRVPDLDDLPVQLCRSCRYLWEKTIE